MSSRIGNVLGGRTTYIGGAPRSQENGQVLMFEPALKTDDKTLHITPDHYLTGDQFGACFGYDIALVDFNGDGWVVVWSVCVGYDIALVDFNGDGWVDVWSVCIFYPVFLVFLNILSCS